jgi:hypothetical protein
VWGLKDDRPSEGKDKGFVNPIFDDGLLEVVGLEGGWKSWAALSGIRHDLHGKRVAQASELKITYHSPKGLPFHHASPGLGGGGGGDMLPSYPVW